MCAYRHVYKHTYSIYTDMHAYIHMETLITQTCDENLSVYKASAAKCERCVYFNTVELARELTMPWTSGIRVDARN